MIDSRAAGSGGDDDSAVQLIDDRHAASTTPRTCVPREMAKYPAACRESVIPTEDILAVVSKVPRMPTY